VFLREVTVTDIKTLGTFIWSIAETLRGDFRQSEYGKVILPFVVLRRLDCILAGSKEAVLKLAATLPEDMDDTARDTILFGTVGKGISVYNLSRFSFATLRGQNAGNADHRLDAIEAELGA
jgi:type I restriction enzyme M protein